MYCIIIYNLSFFFPKFIVLLKIYIKKHIKKLEGSQIQTS